MQAQIDAGGALRGIAIPTAGVVDPADGRIKCANIPSIDGRSLAADLVAGSEPPAWINNDAWASPSPKPRPAPAAIKPMCSA